MNRDNGRVFETKRLAVRLATIDDAEFFWRLWTNPKVMSPVGFPNGLSIKLEEVRQQIAGGGPSEFQQLLVVETILARQAVGECKLHRPNADGIASTDVKLLPEHWGHKYGVEIKRGLLDYLFTHTDCVAVDATPGVANIASIKMQEAVGGVRIGEQTYEFPETMQDYTTPVHYFIYRVSRENWP